MRTVFRIILIFIFFFVLCFCTRMIPERALLEYFDEDYVDDITFNVRRVGRKSGYIVNIGGNIKHTWGNNISVHIFLYEFLHNEYKPTFVEFHFDRICKLFGDPLIGMAVKNAGLTTCPIPKGYYFLPNMSIPFENFPYIWPFEKSRGDGVFLFGNKTLVKGSLYMRFQKK